MQALYATMFIFFFIGIFSQLLIEVKFENKKVRKILPVTTAIIVILLAVLFVFNRNSEMARGIVMLLLMLFGLMMLGVLLAQLLYFLRFRKSK